MTISPRSRWLVLLVVAYAAFGASAAEAAVQLGVEVAQGFQRAYLAEVLPGSLAATNGLMVSDNILDINGRRIHGPADIRSALGAASTGEALRISILREDRFMTLAMRRPAAGAAPYRGRGDMRSAVECIRSPTLDCIDAHLAREFAALPAEDQGTDGIYVALKWARAGEVERARKYLSIASRQLTQAKPKLSYMYVGPMFRAFHLARQQVPTAVTQYARTLALQDSRGLEIVGGLREADYAPFSVGILDQIYQKRRPGQGAKRIYTSYGLRDFVSEYMLHGRAEKAESITSDPRLAWEPRIELYLHTAKELLQVGRAAEARGQLDKAIDAFRHDPDADESAWDLYEEIVDLYWRVSDSKTTLAKAPTMVKAYAEKHPWAPAENVLEVFLHSWAVVGRHDVASKEIEQRIPATNHLSRARAYTSVIRGIRARYSADVQAHRQEPALQPLVERALEHWRQAYASPTKAKFRDVGRIAMVFRLWASSQKTLPASVGAWRAGAAFEPKRQKELREKVANEVLAGLIQAGRFNDAQKWATTHRDVLRDFELRELVRTVAKTGTPAEAVRIGQSFGLDRVAQTVSSARLGTWAAERDFEAMAAHYRAATTTSDRVNTLLALPVQVAAKCKTCVD